MIRKIINLLGTGLAFIVFLIDYLAIFIVTIFSAIIFLPILLADGLWWLENKDCPYFTWEERVRCREKREL